VSPEVEYLRARYAEEEADARAVPQYNGDELWVLDPQYDHYDHSRVLWISPAHVLADLAAKRKILDLHDSWPVLLERIQPEPVQLLPGESLAPNLVAWIEWITTQKYREQFGDDPPTSSIVRALLQPYAGRADFDRLWSL